MSLHSIINEELDAAGKIIKARINELMGGDESSPAPRGLPAHRPPHSDFSTHQPITITRTSDGRANGSLKGNSHNAKAARQTQEDVETLVDYVRQNPGCFGDELVGVLNCQQASDRRYVNAKKKTRKDERLIARGKGQMQAYYVNDEAPTIDPKVTKAPWPNKAKSPGKGKGNAPKVKDPKARDDKLVAYVKEHPKITSPELRDHFKGKPGMGTGEALMSAIFRLCTKGRLKKKLTSKPGAPGHPHVALRAGK